MSLKIDKDLIIQLIFNKVNLIGNNLSFFYKYLEDNKTNKIVKYYKKLEQKCILFFINNSDYSKNTSNINILEFNKLEKLDIFINNNYIDKLSSIIDETILIPLLINNIYYDKLLKLECDIYAILYYIQICLQKKIRKIIL